MADFRRFGRYQGRCLTEAAFAKKELSLEKARALNEEFANPFYEWLISYFEKENGKK